MNENLEYLKHLTANLPSLGGLIKDRANKRIDYAVENGTCNGIAILYKEKVAVQDSYISKGAVFPFHAHDVIEVLVVYEGKVKITFVDENEAIIGAGELIRFDINQLHSCEGLEDSHLIGITIPASPNYPRENTDG
jgi:quercetin dioxygenase-like cupin family protein